MSKKFRALITVAAAAAASIGTAFYLSKRAKQLDVTALENAVIAKYPNAVITSIQKANTEDNLYLVKAIIEEKEYIIFITSRGEIISTSPKTSEEDK